MYSVYETHLQIILKSNIYTTFITMKMTNRKFLKNFMIFVRKYIYNFSVLCNLSLYFFTEKFIIHKLEFLILTVFLHVNL